jgi:hypothetical protein
MRKNCRAISTALPRSASNLFRARDRKTRHQRSLTSRFSHHWIASKRTTKSTATRRTYRIL